MSCTGTPRTVLGVLGSRVLIPFGDSPPGGVVRGGWAGSVTPPGARCGLDGPMPGTIALVVPGRCRPSPDRIPEGAPSDRDARGVVTGGLTSRGGQRPLPVLTSPAGGVGRVDRDDRQALLGGHRHQAGLEFASRHTADEMPEPLAAAVLLSGLLAREVQILNTDRGHANLLGPVHQAGD